MGGKDIHEYFPESESDHPHSNSLEFSIKDVRIAESMKGGKDATIVFLDILNSSEKNLDLAFSLPTVITKEKKQAKATAWLEDYFNSGILYSDCTCESAFCIDPDVIFSIHYGDRIVFEWFEGDSRFEHVLTVGEDNSCFLQSPEEIRKESEVQAYMDMAYEAMDSDDDTSAVHYFTEVLKIDPNNQFALGMRGVCYRGLKKHELALRDLTRSLEIDPSQTHLFLSKGMTNFDLNRKKEARNDIQQFLEMGNPNPDSRELAEYYLAQCKGFFGL